MIPRGKIYINYSDLIAGARYCLFSQPGIDEIATPNKFSCLSVRTGFDLVLTALNLPAGSEIMVADINIPDMFNIIFWHNLVAIPLPVNKHTLNISAQQMEAAITPKTKAILITHLFGSIMDTSEIISIAKAKGLMVFEDCAQTYIGDQYTGNPLTDVVMFSFGFIKTDTAISGAMLHIRDTDLCNRVNTLNSAYPKLRTNIFLKKIFKTMLVKLLTNTSIYTLLYKLTTVLKKDFDTVLSSFTKGFPGDNIFSAIRYRPSKANIRLLQRRLDNFNPEAITKRISRAKSILRDIPDHYKIGSLNQNYSYWVLPIECSKAVELITYLRSYGFDASQKASSLIKLNDTKQHAEDLILDHLIYLPMSDAMTPKHCERLSNLLIRFYKNNTLTLSPSLK